MTRLPVGHLVRAHGADSDGLTCSGPTLEQLRFAHADTHLALASSGMQPPDRHTHPLPLDAGWYEVRERSHRPFLPSPSMRDDPFLIAFPSPHRHTGLSHTGVVPLTEADLANWTDLQPFPDDSGVPLAGIREHADRAAARWLTRAAFPAAAPRGPWIRPGARRPSSDRAASAARARTGRPR